MRLPKLLTLIALSLGLIGFSLLQYARYTPHGFLTWESALLLQASRVAFTSEDWPATDAKTIGALRLKMRQSVKSIARARPAGLVITDLRIAGPAGPLPLRLYRPQQGKKLPVLVFYHGGGHVVGDLDSHDRVSAELAARGRLLLISVDYRLAPEHRFPAAVYDSFAAFLWALGHADAHHGDPARIFVGGDSAGGNLAAAVALEARRTGSNLRGQVLVYPPTNLDDLGTPSYENFKTGYLLHRRKVEWYREQYLPRAADRRNGLASPLLAENHFGLAPALIITAQMDVLRDDGFLYAKKLRGAGVDVTYSEYKGVLHGFLNVHRLAPEGLQAIEEIGRWIQFR